jgi:phage regulator Rha-like protein
MKSFTVLKSPYVTSLEIANIAGVRHGSVRKEIYLLSEDGQISLPPIESTRYTDEYGKKQTTVSYLFTGKIGRKDSIFLMTRLSLDNTSKLEDRWSALEKAESELFTSYDYYNEVLGRSEVLLNTPE